MKVYIVFESMQYEYTEIIGVFSTEKKAIALKEAKEQENNFRVYFRIEKHEVK